MIEQGSTLNRLDKNTNFFDMDGLFIYQIFYIMNSIIDSNLMKDELIKNMN